MPRRTYSNDRPRRDEPSGLKRLARDIARALEDGITVTVESEAGSTTFLPDGTTIEVLTRNEAGLAPDLALATRLSSAGRGHDWLNRSE